MAQITDVQEYIKEKLNNQKLFAILFLPFTCGYFLTTFFNQINAVLATYIAVDIPRSASVFGSMTAVYLLVFAAMQFPLGILLDHFGPRQVQMVSLFVAALGIVIFTFATSSFFLFLGKALVGIGMFGGLMAAFKSIALGFPKYRIPAINSYLMAVGILGAFTLIVPVHYLLTKQAWQELFILLAATIGLLAVWIYLVVPEKKVIQKISIKHRVQKIKSVYQTKFFWRITLLTAAVFGSNMVIIELWARRWLMNVDLYNTSTIANHLLIISNALILGILAHGMLVNFVNRKFKQSITCIIGISVFSCILIQVLIIFYSSVYQYGLWFAFGFFSCAITLSYAAMAQYFSTQLFGRAITALNLICFLCAFAMLYFLRNIINYWEQVAQGAYLETAYKLAFSLILIMQILGFIWFLLLREKKHGNLIAHS